MAVYARAPHSLLVDDSQLDEPALSPGLRGDLQLCLPQLRTLQPSFSLLHPSLPQLRTPQPGFPQPRTLQLNVAESRASQQSYPQTRTILLPYGPTLHYPDCGCPHHWQHGQLRICDHIDLLVQHAFLAFQKGSLAPTRKLKIAYMLPHHNVTGGMKCLIEHIRLLRARGHTTIAVHRSDSATRAMPPWTDDTADIDVVLKLHQRLHHVYPAGDIDVVVVGIFHQVGSHLALSWASSCLSSNLLATCAFQVMLPHEICQ